MKGRKRKPIPSQHETPVIAPPADLAPAATAEWTRVVGLLAASRILSDLDIAALTIYANSYALYRQCQAHIDQHGPVVVGTTGTPVKNPYLLAQKDAWDRMKTLLGELGLTPSARARMPQKPVDDGPAELEF